MALVCLSSNRSIARAFPKVSITLLCYRNSIICQACVSRIYPENRAAKSGDLVKIRIKGTEDTRPYEDTYFTDADYRRVFGECRLELRATHRPLGFASEPWNWVSEEVTAPWVIYELSKRQDEK